MALFIRQDDQRSRLQERLAAELQEKAKNQADNKSADVPDGVKDSQYIKNTKQTSSLAWIWVAIFIIVAAILVWLTIISVAE